MRVSVTWVTPEVEDVVPVELPGAATVADAIAASGLILTYALDPAQLGVAVSGVRRALHDAVHDGERIDLLRALIVDPAQARRERARLRPLRPPKRPPRQHR